MKELDEIKLKGESIEDVRCDCCNDPETQQQQNDRDEHEDAEIKKLLNDKTLIIMGLVLTAAIVILEILIPHSFTTGTIMLVLATPVQLLLGKPFYIRKLNNSHQSIFIFNNLTC